MRRAFGCFLLLFALAGQTFAQNTVACDHWTGASLPTLASGVPDMQALANDPNLLGEPTSFAAYKMFEAPQNIPVVPFVKRCAAAFVAPETGNYRFWIAADQYGMLWLGSNPEFGGKTPIAKMTHAVPPLPRRWGKYTEQKSAYQYLTAGQTYYLLAIQTEAVDEINHMAVGVKLPSTKLYRPIPGSFFNDPVRVSFGVSPTLVKQGFTTELTWKAFYAQSCTASADPPDLLWNSGVSPVGGSQVVIPAANTIYALSCIGAARGTVVSASQAATVVPPVNVALSITPDAFLEGQSATLAWSSVNADSCAASSLPATPDFSGSIGLSGSAVVSPLTDPTYRLTCLNPLWSDTREVTAAVTPLEVNPRTVEFDPSAEHYEIRSDGAPVVTRYELIFYQHGSTSELLSLDIGKPAPDADGKIRVNFSALPGFTYPLGDGLYVASVRAVGPEGSALSALSNIFLFLLGY